jgi:hypothetical protein
MLIFWLKSHFQKHSSPFTSIFIALKQTLQCLMNVFVNFLFIGLILN